jgi:UDP-N-acetylglucosamine 2-epimerase
MSKKIAIVLNEKQIKKIPKDIDLIIISNDDISKKIKNKKIKLLQEYKSMESNKKAIHWLKEWSNKKIINNKNFKELFIYKNVSLWWFGDFWIYYHAMHKNTVMNLINYAQSIKNILEKEKPESIVVIGNHPINEIAKIICQKEKVELHFIKDPFIERLKLFKELKSPYVIEKLKTVKFLTRYFLSKIILRNYKPKNSKNKLLISTFSSLQQKSTDPITGKTKEQDIIFSSIINELNKKIDVTLSDIDYTPNIGIKYLWKNRKKIIPFEYFYTKKVAKTNLKNRNELKLIWKRIEKNKEFQESFNYQGIPLWPLLKDKYKFLITNRFPEAIKYIEIAKNLIKQENPSAVLPVDETGMYSRAILVAAKENKIPTLGMQHGIISKESFEYIHLPKEISKDSSHKSPFCPIPDKTFVYGDYTKKLLIKEGNYPQKTIEVTGQPRYDFISKVDNIFKKEEVYKKFNLDPQKKLVIFATEALEDEESGDLPNAVIQGIKELDPVNFIIKLHPREYKEQYYKSLLKKHNVSAKVIRDYNTFKLLYACDTVIIMHSTIGLEAAMFNKPVVAVNVTGLQDVFPYIEKGIAIGAYKKSEVSKTIKKALYDKKTKKNLESNRQKFIEDNAYRLDGKSTERITNNILKIIKYQNT